MSTFNPKSETITYTRNIAKNLTISPKYKAEYPNVNEYLLNRDFIYFAHLVETKKINRSKLEQIIIESAEEEYLENRAEPELYNEFLDDDSCQFADPGGSSALRATGPDNPRAYPCPTCGTPYRLTQRDVELGYQCDACADRDEYSW